jgi:hypothetical protein
MDRIKESVIDDLESQVNTNIEEDRSKINICIDNIYNIYTEFIYIEDTGLIV